MKTSILIADWVKQINFTPETDNDKEVLSLLDVNDNDINLLIKKGSMWMEDRLSWYSIDECRWWWNRWYEDTKSIMFILKQKKNSDNNV